MHVLPFRPSWRFWCFMASLLPVRISPVLSGCSRMCYAGRRCLDNGFHFGFPETAEIAFFPHCFMKCRVVKRAATAPVGSLAAKVAFADDRTTSCLKSAIVLSLQVCDGRGCIFYRVFCCPCVMTLGSTETSPDAQHFLAPPLQLSAKDIQRYPHLLLCLLPQLCLLPVHALLYKGLLLG